MTADETPLARAEREARDALTVAVYDPLSTLAILGARLDAYARAIEARVREETLADLPSLIKTRLREQRQCDEDGEPIPSDECDYNDGLVTAREAIEELIDELRAGGRYEKWLVAFDAAIDAARGVTPRKGCAGDSSTELTPEGGRDR